MGPKTILGRGRNGNIVFDRDNLTEGLKMHISASQPVIQATSLISRPVLHEVIVGEEDDLFFARYESVAESIGLFSPAFLRGKLLWVLGKNAIPIYEYGQVFNYMKRLAEGKKKIFIWSPLRKKDGTCRMGSNYVRDFGDRTEKSYFEIGEIGKHGSYHCGMNIYGREIPLEMLIRVQTIEREFKNNEFRFFISDYQDTRADPFIMAINNGIEPVVFGMWDEPGFVVGGQCG